MLHLQRSRRPFVLELPAQLTVKTSSSKKRKLARPSALRHESPESPSPDSVLPSCEPEDDDPALSFASSTAASGLDTPSYVRAESQQLPASSLPQRLQIQHGGVARHGSVEDTASVASSPCASAYAELSLDSDKGSEETGPAFDPSRGQSPFLLSRRAIMNGDAELPHRSSSPLKRRASSMDPDHDVTKAQGEDVDMSSSQHVDSNKPNLSRAMSVDMPDAAAESTQRTYFSATAKLSTVVT